MNTIYPIYTSLDSCTAFSGVPPICIEWQGTWTPQGDSLNQTTVYPRDAMWMMGLIALPVFVMAMIMSYKFVIGK